MSAKKLGDILIARELITSEQLQEALTTQLIYGGRLGTVLVQAQLATLEEIGKALSVQHGVPHADNALLNAINRATIATVPEQIAAEHRVLPLRLEGDELHLAMLNPDRQTAGKLAYELKKSIKRYAIPELRLVYHLEKRYGIQRDPRFLRAPSGAANRQSGPLAAVATGPMAQSEQERRKYLEPNMIPEIKTDETDSWAKEMGLVYLDQYGDTPGDQAADIDQPSRLERVLAELDAATSAETIADLLVEPFLDNVAATVLFWVRDGHAVGCRASGITTDMHQLQHLVIPLNRPSLLQWCHQLRGVVRLSASNDPLQAKIAAYLGSQAPDEVFVAPISFRQQIINLLVIHVPADANLPETALESIRLLVQHTTSAYYRLCRRIGADS
ncbi:MAG: hypothetical protein H6707_09845 [Deltaproteobacteria bacterium]|nr:hypothetical protein [Deltaproteobacteria bacterium]